MTRLDENGNLMTHKQSLAADRKAQKEREKAESEDTDAEPESDE